MWGANESCWWPGSGSSLHVSLEPTSLTGPSYSLSFIKPHGVYEEKQRLLSLSPTSFYPGLRNVSFQVLPGYMKMRRIQSMSFACRIEITNSYQ